MQTIYAKAVAEFLGVFLLITLGAGAILNDHEIVAVALAHGFAIFVGISAFAHISGAHFNPAVSLALFYLKRISAKDLVIYIPAQVLVGTTAAFFLRSIYKDGAGLPAVSSQISTSQALVIEFVASFFLAITIIAVAVDRGGSFAIVGGFPIALIIVADIFFAGPLTGAAMNPARWLGPALAMGEFQNAYVWILGPILGALVAAIGYQLLAPKGLEQVSN